MCFPHSIVTLNWSSRLSLGVRRAIFMAGRKRPARFRPATPATASQFVKDSYVPTQVDETWDPLLSLCLCVPHGHGHGHKSAPPPPRQVAAFTELCSAAARTTVGTCRMKWAARRYPNPADLKPRSTGGSKTWPKGELTMC